MNTFVALLKTALSPLNGQEPLKRTFLKPIFYADPFLVERKIFLKGPKTGTTRYPLGLAISRKDLTSTY